MWPKNIKQSIVWTLAYTDLFDYPLTKAELWQRLINTANLRRAFSFRQFSAALRQLIKDKKIAELNSYFFLTGRQKTVALRQSKQKAAALKWQQVASFVRLAKWVPGLQSIWVTGSLAMDNTPPKQDIDFMMITDQHRLWLVRPIIVFLALLVGRKRGPNQHGNQTWCFNLWLDEKHLSLPISKRSIYTAYEVAQAKLVWDKNHSAQVFWRTNLWAQRFLPNWQPLINRKPKLRVLSSWWWDGLEKACFVLQIYYMRHRRTTEEVAEGYAFFHPRPTAKIISERWQDRIKKLSI